MTPLEQLSLAVGALVFAGGTWLAHETERFAGHVIVGAIWSLTVMVCTQLAVFPHRSDAWYVRRMVYLFAHVWLMILSLIKPTATGPEQLSLAVGAPVLTGGTSFAHETVTFCGHAIVGGI